MFLIYGANGYTGELIARTAKERGFKPILAGRNQTEIEKLAGELDLEARIFSLDDADTIDAALDGIDHVLHCAGPFAHTHQAMVDACLRTRTHYLDITGEIGVFEAIARRDEEARDAGVVLMPGVGFDVVPTDCLAAHLKGRLPTATSLTLALHTSGQLSRGTLTTMLENAHRGGCVRQAGKLTPVPAGWKTRDFDFGNGPVTTMTIPWGDVSTAYHSTGIPNIEVYSATPKSMRVAARLSPAFNWLLGSSFVQAFLKKKIRAGKPGPADEERVRGWTHIWGEASDDSGQSVVSRLHGPEGYTFTACAALAVLDRWQTLPPTPGFQTPAGAFGADLVLDCDDVTREDL